ncbi:MAG: hypothetical protein NC078_07150 [Ruminococcus sp.]|nr:hypothetical protein [Ruminococcus sp.]
MTAGIVTGENCFICGEAKIGFIFNEETDGYEICSAKGSTEKLLIPDRINGKELKGIDSDLWELKGFNEVKVSEGNLYFKAVEGVLFSGDMKTLLIYPPEKKDGE